MLSADDIVDLGEELRRAGFKLATQQYLAAQRVVAEMQGRLDSPSASLRLVTFLAPIFCSNPDEQQRFREIYSQWCVRRCGQPKQTDQREPHGPIPLEMMSRLRWLLVSLVPLTVLLAGALWYVWQDTRSRELTGRIVTNGKPVAGAQVRLGAHDAQSDAEGRFMLSFRAGDMPNRLAISAEDFKEVVVDVGNEFRASRRHLYLDATARQAGLHVGDIGLQPPERQEAVQRGPERPSPTEEFGIEPIARLDARDVIKPPPWWQRVDWANTTLISLPLLITAIWLLYRRSRKPGLQRMASSTPPALHDVRLQGGIRTLLPKLPLRRLAQSLRSRRVVQSLEIDTTRTVDATARRGGLFMAVFGSRVEPGYLALIDRTGVADHMAKLASQIVTDLVRSDVLIEQYEFDGDPSVLRCVEPSRASMRGGTTEVLPAAAIQVMTLEELQARYPTRRLLIFAEARTFFDWLTGRPHAWVDQLVSWEQRFVFTGELPEQWGRAEWALEEHGFRVIPLSRTGLVLFSEMLQRSDAPLAWRTKAPKAGGSLHRRTPGLWLERHAPAPAMVRQLCDDLKRDLRPEGFLWLCACAAYPEIHWGLTLRLGAGLLLDHNHEIERALPRLSRLVWFREAFMPDWLRAALLQRLHPGEAERVRAILMHILSSVGTDGADSLLLRIGSQWGLTRGSGGRVGNPLRNFLLGRRNGKVGKGIVREAPENSPLRDYVFLRFISGKRVDLLTPIAPGALLRALFPGGHAWLGWRPGLLLVASALLSGALAFLLPSVLPVNDSLFALHGLAFSPDGKLLASGGGDGTVRLWDVATRAAAGAPLQGHTGKVSSVAFSPDGTLLASGSEDETVQLWDVATRAPVGALLLEDRSEVFRVGRVASVAFSPDGKLLASGGENVGLWDVATRTFLRSLMVFGGGVYSVAFSPDGKLLASGSADGQVRLWDMAAQTPPGAPLLGQMSEGDVVSLAFSPDGKLLASGRVNKNVRLWDVATRTPIGALLGQMSEGDVVSLAFSPDGKLLASGRVGGTVRLWDVATRTSLSVPLQGHKGKVSGLAFNPAGNILASASEDNTIRLWSVPVLGPKQTPASLESPIDTNEQEALRKTASNITGTAKHGFAFYGVMSGTPKERYFRRISGEPQTQPQPGDIVEATQHVNVRKGYIEFTSSGWVNKPIIGLIRPEDRLKVLDVKAVAGDFIWIEFERVPGADFGLSSPGKVRVRTDIMTIPVVVHVVYRQDAENISEEQIKSQIDVLNKDFRAKNDDISKVPDPFKEFIGDAGIEFTLAKVDPFGRPTTGITRTRTTQSSFTSNDSVKSQKSGGTDPWDPERYLNIWVCTLSDGMLAYSHFPDDPKKAKDGVVVNNLAFGTGGIAKAPHDKGRVLAEQIGHYLDLRHIWGDTSDCSGSDFVADTPNQKGPNFGKPIFPHISCNNGPNGDMFMNFMDYVDDDAKYMFTKGQVTRMRETLKNQRSKLVMQSRGRASVTDTGVP